MPVVEAESIVLKTYNLAEADKIVLLFTREHGIVRGVAKGAKRLKSRFGSALEPFSIVRVSYFQKEVLELVSIQHIELVNSYFAAASDPQFLEKFSYLTEILVGSVPPQDPSETLYRMVRSVIQTAAERRETLESVGLYFEVWLLRLTGYLPQWKNCYICGREFGGQEPAGLGANFELACGTCRRLTSLVEIGPKSRSALVNALRLSPSDFADSVSNRTDIHGLSEILKRVLSHALGKPVAENPSLAAPTVNK